MDLQKSGYLMGGKGYINSGAVNRFQYMEKKMSDALGIILSDLLQHLPDCLIYGEDQVPRLLIAVAFPSQYII